MDNDIDIEKQELNKNSSVEENNRATVANTSIKERQEEDHDGKLNLNAYSFYPTTIPPFVLDSEYQQVNSNANVDVDWDNFAQNIGNNISYSYDQRVNINKDRRNSINSIITSTDVYSEDERNKIRNEVLNDLDSAWGGAERLEAIFNLPIDSNYRFKSQKDKKDWLNYINKVKQFYYNDKNPKEHNKNMSLSSLSSMTSSSGSTRIAPPHLAKKKIREPPEELRKGSGRHRGGGGGTQLHMDWLEELNKDREHWRKLRQKKLQKWKPPLFRLLIDNQYLPLAFRVMIGIFCIISLGLAVRIFQNSDSNIAQIEKKSIPQQPSTIMAICVNSIAIAYTIYIAHDEFSGKPLGLRNPLSKLKLILLDLLFIIFASANLALAFNTRFDKEWVCTNRFNEDDNSFPKISYICRKQKALSSFLFILLFMWVSIFTVSIFRVVEKVSSSSSRD